MWNKITYVPAARACKIIVAFILFYFTLNQTCNKIKQNVHFYFILFYFTAGLV